MLLRLFSSLYYSYFSHRCVGGLVGGGLFVAKRDGGTHLNKKQKKTLQQMVDLLKMKLKVLTSKS